MIAKIVLALNSQNWSHEEERIKKVVNCKVTHCLGSYKGKTERSYMIDLPTETETRKLAELAASHNQESILIVDYAGNAFLMYTDGSKKVEDIGQWGEIDREYQDGLSNWTLTEHGKLYTVL